MSHFTLLAIGDDYEAQLEPFNENTEVEPYIESADASDSLVGAFEFLVKPPTEEEKERAGYTESPETKELREKYRDRDVASLTDEEKLEVMGWYSDGSDRYRIENGVLVEYSTYNPNSKWDWYQIGGRWRGFFKLRAKAGSGVLTPPHWSETFNGETPEDLTGFADQARKRDIDFDGMRDEAERKARERFAEFEAVMKESGSRPTESWAQCRERHAASGGTIDDARAEYNGQPWVQASRKLGYFMEDPYELFCLDQPDPLEAYVAKARATAIQTYAMLYEGKWIAKGDMGWFGLSNDTEDDVSFGARQWELIQSLPDDTLLTLLDLHI